MALLYAEQTRKKNSEKTEEIMKSLPDCFNVYLFSITRLSAATRLLYAQKLLVFFRYLLSEHPAFMNKSKELIHYADMEQLTYEDFDIFIDYILNKDIRKTGKINSDKTVNTYLTALSNMYQLWVDREYVAKNPVKSIQRGRPKKKPIVRLEGDENKQFVDGVFQAKNFSKRELAYRQKHNTQLRDTLIIKTLDTTGLRVSELVGLDINDLDMEHKRFLIRRKGGKMENIYFSDSLAAMIQDYLIERESYKPSPSENALFLVSQGSYIGQRISQRSVQNLVKKYAAKSDIFGAEQLTPHKLRHSYAMRVLKQTGNLALVQKELGHDNIRTTTVYAQADDDDLKAYRNITE